jgi:hypothetical protein
MMVLLFFLKLRVMHLKKNSWQITLFKSENISKSMLKFCGSLPKESVIDVEVRFVISLPPLITSLLSVCVCIHVFMHICGHWMHSPLLYVYVCMYVCLSCLHEQDG